jgi:hypothetical protein
MNTEFTQTYSFPLWCKYNGRDISSCKLSHVYLEGNPFFISALYGSEWSASRPGLLTSGKKALGTPCVGCHVDPELVLEATNPLPLLGNEPGIPGHSARSLVFIPTEVL